MALFLAGFFVGGLLAFFTSIWAANSSVRFPW